MATRDTERGAGERSCVGAALVALVFVVGCSSPGEGAAARPLPELARPADQNPDPQVLEVQLEARMAEVEYLSGKRTEVWSYDGTVPGPLLEARVGDELVVHFRNNLPEATTIHWHGLRVPAAMDGTEAMQSPIAPGGTFEYRFRLEDAGLFWFHPHVRSDIQVERGLYGVILVRGDDALPVLGRERILVLDDVQVDAEGRLADPEDIGSMEAMTGRQGNVLLANGVKGAELEVTPGERLRLRVVNTATARYFRLGLPGRRMHLLGVDGGLLERPREVDEVLLAPGERADLAIDADGEAGEVWELLNQPYDRGHMTGGGSPGPVLQLRFAERPRLEAEPLPGMLRTIAPLPAPSATRRLVLTEDMDMGGGMGSGPTFRINGEAFPNVTPLETSLDAVESWEVVNETEMDHPFHLHGFFFQVAEQAGAPAPFLAWKDTVNVPAESSLRFLVRFEQHPGRWMYHCHILEHGERGMMGELLVQP
ncbi:MAG: multicopper oxidase family protein [Myxococcaceae bacterium]|nr:multicopper oxidase family protein [Myxococcaceae bacterium]MCI0672368.1 multicopper oxidase family protein [Myxococcaceae bacterium]